MNLLDFDRFLRSGPEKQKRTANHFAVLYAGDERIELPPKVLETPIIPFDQSPVPNHKA